jgi:hypothetical protein
MNTMNGRLRAISCVLSLLVSLSLAQTPDSVPSSDWKAVVQNRLPLYGHRNSIVVADSAFPVYANSGIETIVVNDDLPSVAEVCGQRDFFVTPCASHSLSRPGTSVH